MIHVSDNQPLHSTHVINHNDIWIDESMNDMYRYSAHNQTWARNVSWHGPKPFALRVNNKSFAFSKADMLSICKKYTVKSFILNLNENEYAKFLLKYS